MTTNRFTGLLLGYAHNRSRTVVYGYDGDDRIVRKCRTAHACAGHFRHYGRQYRYHAHRMDHDARLLFQHGRCGIPGVLHCPLLIYSKKRRYIGDFLFGIAFMFFGLEPSPLPVSKWI